MMLGPVSSHQDPPRSNGTEPPIALLAVFISLRRLGPRPEEMVRSRSQARPLLGSSKAAVSAISSGQIHHAWGITPGIKTNLVIIQYMKSTARPLICQRPMIQILTRLVSSADPASFQAKRALRPVPERPSNVQEQSLNTSCPICQASSHRRRPTVILQDLR